MENSALRSSSLGTWAKPLAWPKPQTSGCRCPTRGLQGLLPMSTNLRTRGRASPSTPPNRGTRTWDHGVYTDENTAKQCVIGSVSVVPLVRSGS